LTEFDKLHDDDDDDDDDEIQAIPQNMSLI